VLLILDTVFIILHISVKLVMFMAKKVEEKIAGYIMHQILTVANILEQFYGFEATTMMRSSSRA